MHSQLKKVPSRVVILGAGASMREGKWNTPISEMPLWSVIKQECTFGINSIFEFFTPTVTTFIDYYFHQANKKKLDNLPLIIGKDHPNPDKSPIGDNLILLPVSNKYYGKKSFEQVLKKTSEGHKIQRAGFYCSQLTGLFSLTLAIALGFQDIYLLGFDFGEIDGKTHFYQESSLKKQEVGKIIKEDGEINCGIGRDKNGNFRTSCYSNDKPEDLFNVYKGALKNVNIYNVSPDSKINTFPKISYETFYKHLKNEPLKISQTVIQDRIRNNIEYKMS